MELKQVIKATSLEEVLDILENKGENAKLIAGGTDIVIALRTGKVSPEVMVDISGLKELNFVNESGDIIEIGAATSFTTIENEPKLKGALSGLSDAAYSVGSPQIRNRGTIGGNICNGSPAADTVPPFLALGAVAVLKSKNETREVELNKFFLDKEKVDLKSNEMLYSVKFNKAQGGQGLGFSKLGLRKALAISRLSVSVFVEIDKDNVCKAARVASGSLGKYPMREKEIEEFLLGKNLSDNTVQEAAELFRSHVEKKLAGRSTMEFKKEAIMGTFKDALRKAISNSK
jgi:CO/xanthine dehydrogenase FAD-binding subunit